MRAAVASVAIAGLAAVSVLVLRLGGGIPEPADTELTKAEASPVPPVASEATTSTTLSQLRDVRAIAPEIVARPPIRREALVRVEPRGPLSKIGTARSPLDGPPEETLLHRPSTGAAGSFEAQGYHVQFAGIVPTDPDETCESGGGSWPCGVHARTAFRNWLRGRALSCVVPPAPPDKTLVLDCMRGSQNPAEWLVAQGWARAVEGGPFAALEEEARREGRGIFGPGPLTAGALPGDG
jgi:endonuclease YncB( thermonuclease family)